jgi:hypothetical protein
VRGLAARWLALARQHQRRCAAARGRVQRRQAMMLARGWGALSPPAPAGCPAGAHADKGRGNEFLRHIERTRCLAYIVDLSGGPGGLVALTPVQQLAVLQVGWRWRWRCRIARGGGA